MAVWPHVPHSQVGGFSALSGRFAAPERSGEKYFESKGIPKHRDERQLGHYFDFGAWQEARNRERPQHEANRASGKRARH